MKNFSLLLVMSLMSQVAFAVVDGDPSDKGDEKTFSCQFAEEPCAPNSYHFRNILFTKWANEFNASECKAAVEQYKNQLGKVETTLGLKDNFEVSSAITTSQYNLPNTSGDLVNKATAAGFKVTSCSIKIKSRSERVSFEQNSRRFFVSGYYWFADNNFEQNGMPKECVEKLDEAKTDIFKLMPHITSGGSLVAGYCGVRYFGINVK